MSFLDYVIQADLTNDLTDLPDFGKDTAVLAYTSFLVWLRLFLGPCNFILVQVISVHPGKTADSLLSLHSFSAMHSERP